jgi:N-acetylneuraminic acid mutarotase
LNRTIALLLVLVSLSASFMITAKTVSGAAASENTWVTKAPMSSARAYLGVAVVNGTIYAIGGDQGSDIGNVSPGTSMTYQVVNVTEAYDPKLNLWVGKAQMPTARALFGTAVYQNKIYCIGGYSGGTVFIGPESWNYKTVYYDLGANEVYDPAANTWVTKSALPTPRYSAATNIVNGKIYVIGGHTMSNLELTLSANEVYDSETDSWTTKSSPPLPVIGPGSAVVDDKIYVLGVNQKSPGSLVMEIYDPGNDSWSVGEATPVGYWAAAAATSGMNALKRIYFLTENKTDVFDPSTNSWSVGAPAPTSRLIANVAVVNDVFYLIGGRTGQWGYITMEYPSTLNEAYTPIGYGTPDPDYESPAPSPTLSPTPTPTESLSPSASPSSTASGQQPASSPNPQQTTLQTELIYATAATVAIIIVAVAAVMALRKRRKKNTVKSALNLSLI